WQIAQSTHGGFDASFRIERRFGGQNYSENDSLHALSRDNALGGVRPEAAVRGFDGRGGEGRKRKGVRGRAWFVGPSRAIQSRQGSSQTPRPGMPDPRPEPSIMSDVQAITCLEQEGRLPKGLAGHVAGRVSSPWEAGVRFRTCCVSRSW